MRRIDTEHASDTLWKVYLKLQYKNGELMQNYVSLLPSGAVVFSAIPAPTHVFKDEFLPEVLCLPDSSKWQNIIALFVGPATDTSPIAFDFGSSDLLLQETVRTSTPS